MGLKQTALNIVIKAKDLTKGTLEKFRRDVKKTDQAAERASTNGLKKLGRAIGGVIAAYASFAGIKGLITGVLGTGDKFEKLGIQMEAAMGSIESGEKATAWIKEFTKTTPLQLEDTTNAFLKLKNFGLDPMDGSLQAVVDQNEKLGGGQERLTGIANALGQAWAKQKLQGEEVLQLVERGVPVYELLEKVTGKTGTALADMQKNGELTRDTIKGLIEEMGKAADGAAIANMSTMSGIISNLKDRWQEWLGTVADNGALDSFKGLLKDLSGQLDKLAKNGTLDRWAKNTSNAIVGLFEASKSLAVGIYEARGAILLLGQAWAAAKLAGAYTSVAALGRSFVQVLTPGVVASTGAVTAFNKAMSGIVWIAVVKGITDVTAATYEWIKAKVALRDSERGLAQMNEQAATRIAEYVKQTGLAATSLDDLIAATDNGTAIFDAANGLWITGKDAIAEYKAGLDETTEAVESLGTATEENLEGAVKRVQDRLRALMEDSDNAEGAIEKLLGEHDLGVEKDIAAVVTAMESMIVTGQITEEQIRDGVGEAVKKLTADELVDFALALRKAFEGGSLGAAALASTLGGVVSRALSDLGVDLELITTKISSIGTDAIAEFKVVADNIRESGLAADKAGQVIVEAYKAAFAKVKTEAGKKKLLEELREQLKQGAISAYEFSKALEAQGDQADKDSVQVNGLIERVRELQRVMADDDNEGGTLGDNISAGADQAAGAMALVMGAVEGYKAQMADLGQGAEEAFNQVALGMEAPAEATEALTDRMFALKQEIEGIRKSHLSLQDTSGLQTYLTSLRSKAREVELAFVEQKYAAQQLWTEYDNGGLSADLFIQKAERMVKSSELLDDQDLSRLTSGIEQASAEMDRLGESTDRTLANLQNKLDRLRGDTESAEKRQFEQQITDLEAQLEVARAQKNKEAIADLEQSLGVVKEIYETEKTNRAEAKQERDAREQERLRNNPQGEEKSRREANTGTAQNTSSQQVIELKLGGQNVAVSTDNPSGLLELLSQAGLRTS